MDCEMDPCDIDKLSRLTGNLEDVGDDTVQCIFFYMHANSDPALLDQLCESLNSAIKSLSAEYVWHRDEMKIIKPILAIPDFPNHLTSTVCFGDNLEDEWFIVYLVLEITKQFTDVIVQIKDGDGEFLLIEAADFLPSWANPDTTDNRVFIYQNRVHIIPPSLADTDSELQLKDAIKLVTEYPDETQAPNLQQAIMKRISNYPDGIKDNFHRAIAKLPVEIAAVLKIKPSLISPIVTMYCNHDFIDAKACKNMNMENCVTTNVKFTKFLYAKLIHSNIIRTIKLPKLHDRDKKGELGLKLACGYEMIMSKLSQDIFSTSQFQRFKKTLTDSGYFRGNIDGSQQYNQLLCKAKKYYLDTEVKITTHVSNAITEIKSTEQFNEIKSTLLNQTYTNADLEEDNEDWLKIHPEQLNDFLNSRYGQPSNFKNDDVISSNTITSELTSFLKKTSDFEGIETKEDIEHSYQQKIEFNPDEFVHSLESMLKIIASGDSNVDSQMLSDFSDDDMDESQDEEKEIDAELKSKLVSDDITKADKGSAVRNILQSMKEEGAFSGPSSNILRNIGINKIVELDSDDDTE